MTETLSKRHNRVATEFQDKLEAEVFHLNESFGRNKNKILYFRNRPRVVTNRSQPFMFLREDEGNG